MSNPVTITFTLEGVSVEEAERLRKIVGVLLLSGALSIRRGSAEIYFDHMGTLQLIETHVQRWRRERDSTGTLASTLDSGKIDVRGTKP